MSIGLPVYNGADHLPDAIESVLSQTFTDFELVISDNASTDDTERVCRDFMAADRRIRYYRSAQNMGAAWNYNNAFSMSRGQYFKWLAHDDVLAPIFLEHCVETLRRSPPSVVLAFTQWARISRSGQPARPRGRRRTLRSAGAPYDRISFARLLRVPDNHTAGFVFGLARREALARTGLIRSHCFGDVILVSELRLLGAFRQAPCQLHMIRTHENTESFKKERGTLEGELHWWDPTRRHRTRTRMHAEAILLRSRLALVLKSSLPVYLKAWFCCVVLFWHVVVRARRRLHGIYRLWERASVWMLRRSAGAYLFHRVWALVRGVRTRDMGLVSLAFSSPSRTSADRLLAFVAGRLRRRSDHYSRELLEDWGR